MTATNVRNLFDLDFRLIRTPEPDGEETRQFWMAKGPTERANYVTETVTVHFEEFVQAVQSIDAHLERAQGVAGPGGLLITGDGGSGKTFLADYCLRRYPPKHSRTRSFIPLIRVDLDESHRPEKLLTSVSLALGDLTAHANFKGERREESVIKALKSCRTHGIFFNEAQRMMLTTGKRADERAAGAVGDCLMRIYDEAGVAFFFLAKEGLAQLWNQDKQLRTRWSGRIHLSYFANDVRWVGLLTSLDAALPMPEQAGLGTSPLRDKLHTVSEGVLRTLKLFLSESVRLAATEGSPRLTEAIFHRVFYNLAMPGSNPFTSK